MHSDHVRAAGLVENNGPEPADYSGTIRKRRDEHAEGASEFQTARNRIDGLKDIAPGRFAAAPQSVYLNRAEEQS